MSNKLQVTLAQIAPVWLDRDATIAKIGQSIADAAADGSQLITFGEALLPGYPFWIELTGGAEFESSQQKDFHARYLDQAVNISVGHLKPICTLARQHKIAVILGTIERAPDRGNHSVFCSLIYIDNTGEIANVHRKLMPTYEERLSWAPGDGAGLVTQTLPPFTVGALNCWENWMPLPRAALYGQGENLHVAIWPGNVRNTEMITRFIATESRSYVLSVSGLMSKDLIPDDFPYADELRANAPEVMGNGGSCIASPTGEWLVEPVADKETLIHAELDINEVLRERQNFDPSGHYARPDVTRLTVDRRRKHVTDFIDD